MHYSRRVFLIGEVVALKSANIISYEFEYYCIYQMEIVILIIKFLANYQNIGNIAYVIRSIWII